MAVIAVRRRLMNAVFFFSDESRDLLTEKTSKDHVSETDKDHKEWRNQYLFRLPMSSG